MSTTQGHLRAFHWSNITQVTNNKHLDYLEYNTKRAHYKNIKHIHNANVSPFGIVIVKKMANKTRSCWYH